MSRHDRPLSSRELLSRIGLSEDVPPDLFDAGALDDLEGDLGGALRQRFTLLNAEHQFAPGDLVTWKPGLKNRRVPRYGEPAVVVSVLEAPVLDSEEETGSTYFRDPLSLVLGVIWERDPGRRDCADHGFEQQQRRRAGDLHQRA